MELLNYACAEDCAIPPKKCTPLIKTTAGNFTEESPVISSYRRYLCMNMKKPNVLRVLNRFGKFVDTTVQSTSVRHLCSTEGVEGHQFLFFAVGDTILSILAPSVTSTGEIQINTVTSTLTEEIFAATPGGANCVYALGQRNVYEVDERTGEVKSQIAVAAKTVVKFPTFHYHPTAKLLLVPTKTVHMDLISTQTQKSVLSKVWEPHADTVPTFAYFFAVHQFSEEPANEVLLITAAKNNSNIRFWSYQSATQKFSLKQDITIAPVTEHPDFILSVSPSEDYLTLASRNQPLVVVIETHRTIFKAHRITTWTTPGPSLCCTTYVTKVAETSQSKSFSCELCIGTRTEDGFYQTMFDTNKLAGSSNTAALSSKDSVHTWFANSGPAAAGAQGARVGPPQRTEVSSSLLGDSRPTNALSEATAAKMLHQQSQKFCDQIRVVDDDLVSVQKVVSELMCYFQDSRFRESAQLLGRQFAVRNRTRLENGSSSSPTAKAEPGMMTQGQRELILAIEGVAKEAASTTTKTASDTVKSLLSLYLKGSIKKASSDLGSQPTGFKAVANLSSTEAVKQYRKSMETTVQQIYRALQVFISQQKDSHDSSATTAALNRAKDFRERWSSSIRSIRQSVSDTNEVVTQLRSGGDSRAGGVDPHVLVARAVDLAEKKHWSEAVNVALEARDLSVLLDFLSSKVCVENQAEIVSPKNISIVLFLAVCQQLTIEMDLDPGLAPLRVSLLHRFYMAWDDTLLDLKKQSSNGKPPQTLGIAQRQLASIRDSLNVMDEAVPMDRKTRNHSRLVRALISEIVDTP